MTSSRNTTPWTAADLPDLTGRTVVVTGANSGIGRAAAKAFAAHGAAVTLAVRDVAKGEAAAADMPGGAVDVRALDLTSLDSVRAFADARQEHVDILVNNAGVMGIPERRTVDGFEMQFGVDHLGHWTLTALLMPALLRADAARIVTVTSTAHHMGRAVNPENPHLEGRYGPWRAYGQAKLANYHFGLGLHRALERAGAPAGSLIAHPGLSNTELQAVSVEETSGGMSQRFFLFLARNTGMAADDGCRSQLRAATDPNAESGEFYGPAFFNNGPPVRKPILRRMGMARAVARLWEVSERETGVRIDVDGGAAPSGGD